MSYHSAPVVALLASIMVATAGNAQSNRDNDVIIDQIGTDNSAIITQQGQVNLAGSEVQPMVQDGIYNALTIFQRGMNNTIGLSGPGVFQFGRLNTFRSFNQITLTQDSDGNEIGSIYQASLGSIVNGVNTLSITQQTGDRNLVNSVRQIQESGQAAQRATISQTGHDNVIDRVEQRSNGTGREGPNEIDVQILGSNNGRVALSGFAGEPIVADSSILQEADTVDPGIYGNKVVLDIIGDDNRFGIRQGGRMNDVGRLLVNGDQNQLGLRQDGTENNIQMSAIEGDGNEIGIDQMVTNIAAVNLIGQSDDNRIYAFQQGTNHLQLHIQGNQNTFRLRQDYLAGRGGLNDADVYFEGNSNFADIEQFGSNILAMSITGDRNNASGVLGGDAGIGGLTAGFFAQNGFNNVMSFTVTGNDNLLAASQTGNNNMITALINGNLNQAAVVQSGAENIAELAQNGSNNNAGIYQN